MLSGLSRKIPMPQIYALATYMFVALMNACVKGLEGSIPVSLILLCRFSIGLMFLAPMIYRLGGYRQVMKTNHPYRQIIRAILSTTGVAISIYAVPMLPLADGTALWQTTGFFLLLVSGFVTGEKIHPKFFLTCGLGFLGVLLILHPSGDVSYYPAFLMLFSALLAAVTTLTVRVVSRKDGEVTIMSWFFSISWVISFVWYGFFSKHPTLSLKQTLLLIGAATAGVCSQLCMVRAYKALGADAIGPYTYSGILFSTVLGLMFFSEIPTLWMVGGAACIILAIQLNHRLMMKQKSSAPSI